MAEIKNLSRIVNGVQRNVDLSVNTLVVDTLKVGGEGGAGSDLTKVVLDKLISLQNGTDFATGTNSHTHDGRYFTETELGAITGTTGSELIGDDDTYTNFSSTGNTVKGTFESIDGVITSLTGGTSLVKVSAADTTAGYLDDSLTAGSGLSKSITNPGANEVLDLAVNVDDSSIEINADALRVKASGVTSAMLAGSIDATKIADGSVTSTEFQYINTLSSNAQTQLTGKVDKAGSSMDSAANITFSGGGEVLGLPSTPSAAGAAASKAYVDAVALGLAPKKAVRVATTAAGTLASSFEDGDVIDGITLATGDRILIKDQASASQNGIYTVNASGAPTRSTDMDSLTPIDEVNGAWVPVQFGTVNAGRVFVQYGTVATIGTDPINFEFYNPLASITGGDMITVSGSNVSIDLASSSGLESTNPGDPAGQLRIANSGVTLARMADLAANSFIGNATGSAATPTALGGTAATALLNNFVGDSGSGGVKGLVPAPSAGQASYFLRGDGSWQLVGSGANAALSNLSSVAINTSLVFATGVAGELRTFNQSGPSASTGITVASGTTASGTSGSATFTSGSSSSGTTGNIQVSSGGGGVGTGLVSIKSGDAGTGNSGNTSVLTGNSTSSGTGAITIQTGNSGSTSASGSMTIKTGNTDSATAAGSILIQTGSPNGGGGLSGAIDIKTGVAALAGSQSATITIKTGDASGSSSTSGDISLEVGYATGTKGKIKFVDSSEGTIGHVWTSSTVGGGGTWAALNPTSLESATNVELTASTVSIAANTLKALRYGQPANSETAGRIYLADNDATTNENYYLIGLVYHTSTINTGSAIPKIIKAGLITVTGHGFTVGKPVYLGASGALTSTAPTAANSAVVKVGLIKDANTIDVQIQVMGVN